MRGLLMPAGSGKLASVFFIVFHLGSNFIIMLEQITPKHSKT